MLPIIDPTELIPAEFDFNDLLADYTGAAITAMRISIEVISGIDANTSARLFGPATEAALVVKQWFQPDAAQLTETKYRLACNIDIAGSSYKPTIAIELTVKKRFDA